MSNSIKVLAITLAVISFGFSIACQQAKQDLNSTASAIAVTSTDKSSATQSSPPATTPGSSGEQASQEGESLSIISVNITSPSREPVIIPGNGNEGVIVHGRIWETLDLECITQDDPGHRLTYTWECSSGRIKGTGSKVIWTAPGAGGDYTLTVTVNCDHDETAQLTIDTEVKCCGD